MKGTTLYSVVLVAAAVGHGHGAAVRFNRVVQIIKANEHQAGLVCMHALIARNIRAQKQPAKEREEIKSENFVPRVHVPW